MLNSLIIQNFRCLEDLTFNHLARVNLLVGRNNVGKSTVLEALRIYAGNANQELLEEIAKSHDETLSEDYKEFFTNKEHKAKKNILILESEISEEETAAKEFRDKFICRKSHRSSTYILKSKAEKIISCSFISTSFISMEELEKEWRDIELTDNENIVTQALQIIVPNFQRLSFEGKVLFSEFSHRIYDPNKKMQSYQDTEPLPTAKLWIKVKLANNPKPVPLKSLGDGMLRILQIAIKLVSAQGGFLLIDEFENGLHYSVQEKIWDLLFKMAELLDVQVFVTTHSLDCVKSFCTVWEKEGNQDKGSFHRLFLHPIKNQIDVMPYQLDALDKSIELDVEVR